MIRHVPDTYGTAFSPERAFSSASIRRMRSAFQSQEVAAFTLIEMMVVIGVIGVLTALLLPVLSKARDRARTVSCADDLKQLQTSWPCRALGLEGHQDFPIVGSVTIGE